MDFHFLKVIFFISFVQSHVLFFQFFLNFCSFIISLFFGKQSQLILQVKSFGRFFSFILKFTFQFSFFLLNLLFMVLSQLIENFFRFLIIMIHFLRPKIFERLISFFKLSINKCKFIFHLFIKCNHLLIFILFDERDNMIFNLLSFFLPHFCIHATIHNVLFAFSFH